MINVRETFEKFQTEFCKFNRIENPPSKKQDLCAFLLLDKLLPNDKDIVAVAEHDEIWLDTDITELEEVATEEDIIYLLRCGVVFDSDIESLTMYV